MQDIHVYERLPAPAASDDSSVWGDTARFYLIGLGGRGQKALQELGAWEPVKRRSVVVLGRKDWAPGAGVDEGVERIFGDDRPYKTTVIPRDRLAGVLREVALDAYAGAITLHYDAQLTAVRWEAGPNPSPDPNPTLTPTLTLTLTLALTLTLTLTPSRCAGRRAAATKWVARRRPSSRSSPPEARRRSGKG